MRSKQEAATEPGATVPWSQYMLRDDGLIHPVMHAEILTCDGAWIKALFLLDTDGDWRPTCGPS
jgi:hypothetical protein